MGRIEDFKNLLLENTSFILFICAICAVVITVFLFILLFGVPQVSSESISPKIHNELFQRTPKLFNDSEIVVNVACEKVEKDMQDILCFGTAFEYHNEERQNFYQYTFWEVQCSNKDIESCRYLQMITLDTIQRQICNNHGCWVIGSAK